MTGYALFFDTQYRIYLNDNTKGVSKERLKTAVFKQYITDVEYKEITGEVYA